MKVKPITLEDYKSYLDRKGITNNMSDQDLQKVLDLGNKKEQEFIEDRAARAEKHRAEMESLLEKGLPEVKE